MEFIKEWTFSVCITLIISVFISLLLPAGTMGKYSKIVVSMFIFLSLILPITKSNITFALPETDFIESVDSQEESYSRLIEAKIKENLNSAGYTGVNVYCEVSIKGDDDLEIDVKNLTVYIPDEYDKEEILQFIYDSLGMTAEVYFIGE